MQQTLETWIPKLLQISMSGDGTISLKKPEEVGSHAGKDIKSGHMSMTLKLFDVLI